MLCSGGQGSPWHCRGPLPPPRSSLLCFAFCLVRALQEQKADDAREGLPSQPRCVRCCPPPEKHFYPQYQPMPQINVTILKGEGWQDPMLCCQQCPSSRAGLGSQCQLLHRLGMRSWGGASGPVPCTERARATLGCEQPLLWWLLGSGIRAWGGAGAGPVGPCSLYSSLGKGLSWCWVQLWPLPGSPTVPPALPRREGGPW